MTLATRAFTLTVVALGVISKSWSHPSPNNAVAPPGSPVTPRALPPFPTPASLGEGAKGKDPTATNGPLPVGSRESKRSFPFGSNGANAVKKPCPCGCPNCTCTCGCGVKSPTITSIQKQESLDADMQFDIIIHKVSRVDYNADQKLTHINHG
ncbi:hypothetical protein H4R34_006352 [Dimargaris verticillata]|uniref:Uncharacterized protein n=1 Tax=Dimargaris verticillata TaxID=2761393 RepID=A0A9W8AT39_9FUNG|nr:hypothetical protein H4R34_006352 [Dimargaris verticillata]